MLARLGSKFDEFILKTINISKRTLHFYDKLDEKVKFSSGAAAGGVLYSAIGTVLKPMIVDDLDHTVLQKTLIHGFFGGVAGCIGAGIGGICVQSYGTKGFVPLFGIPIYIGSIYYYNNNNSNKRYPYDQ